MTTVQRIFEHIAEANRSREEDNLSGYACLSRTAARRRREKMPDSKNIRPAFFHDTDRIIHSLAYSRYIDKTQVFYLFENDHITHRVLHVQFVAKIGRVIGRALRLNEDLIEAIALGHDLGHAPYGHDGEKVLDKLCRDNHLGSFSHNIQSVRFLMDIEKNGAGLNLSLQVLDGILSHNGEILGRRYCPDYRKGSETFLRQYKASLADSRHARRIVPMTMEGCVARICDIIAYIGRDIEDAITLKIITRDSLPLLARRVLGDSNDRIINTLVEDIIVNSYGKPYLEFSPEVFKALQGLRAFNYAKIYSNPAIKTQEHKVADMFKRLYEKYLGDIRRKDKVSFVYRYWLRMNARYRRATTPGRAVVDFIAGMTDDFFNNQFVTLFVPQSYGYVYKKDR